MLVHQVLLIAPQPRIYQHKLFQPSLDQRFCSKTCATCGSSKLWPRPQRHNTLHLCDIDPPREFSSTSRLARTFALRPTISPHPHDTVILSIGAVFSTTICCDLHSTSKIVAQEPYCYRPDTLDKCRAHNFNNSEQRILFVAQQSRSVCCTLLKIARKSIAGLYVGIGSDCSGILQTGCRNRGAFRPGLMSTHDIILFCTCRQ